MGNSRHRGVNEKPAQEIIRWIESVSGLMTHVRTAYGDVDSMLGSPEWDDSKTEYLLGLVKCVRCEIAEFAEELQGHVSDYSQEGFQRLSTRSC